MTNQKLYLIPTTPSYEYEPYNHIYLVTASSDQEAYEKAKTTLDANIPQELSKYESYDCYTKPHHLPSYPFHESEKYDILNSIFLNTKGFEYMAYFNVNWNDYTDELSKLTAQEEWSNTTYPDKKDSYKLHGTYIQETHIREKCCNKQRIPDRLKDDKNILNNLNGSIDTMKKKVSANYKLAIPQYYEGKIQLLLPLCLEDDETPSLVH